ncbi:MAG: manganese efflux pump [Firmicutes bacterium]|nr:manganese efflux pump [Bacillota bacterium]
MGTLETFLIGAGLAMDAVAVSMTNGMVYKDLRAGHYIAMPLLFGIFQGAMPLLGFFTGNLFAEILDKYSGIVILIILGFIGGKMVYEGISHKDDENLKPQLTFTVLLFQSVATSIDAFAVGVAFTAMRVNIIYAVFVIAVVTSVLVAAAIVVGRKMGDVLGPKAEILGGIILIIIGIKGMF